MYKINNIEYNLKEKYTLKEWGLILKILQNFGQEKSITEQIVILLTDDKLLQLLNTILDKPIEGEIYEEDFEEVNKIIRDFFSRKSGLIKNTGSSLEN